MTDINNNGPKEPGMAEQLRQERRSEQRTEVEGVKAKKVGEATVSAAVTDTDAVLDEIDAVLDEATIEPTDSDLDRLMAEIDALLEHDSQEFVDSFVQKGGQ